VQLEYGVCQTGTAKTISGLQTAHPHTGGVRYPEPPIKGPGFFVLVEVAVGHTVFAGTRNLNTTISNRFRTWWRHRRPPRFVNGPVPVHSTLEVDTDYATLEIKINYVEPQYHRPGEVRAERKSHQFQESELLRQKGDVLHSVGKLYAHDQNGSSYSLALTASTSCPPPKKRAKTCRWLPVAGGAETSHET